MNLIPPVRAELAERYIFNFRLPPDALAEYLPAPWLSPQTVRGWGVASFCLLDLRGITPAPLSPAFWGLDSVSCAPRYAVLDGAGGGAKRPAVFVTERQTSSAFGAWFTGLGFSCRHPYAEAQIVHQGERTEIQADDSHGGAGFCATVTPSAPAPSALFDTPADFGAFIAQGVTSYGLSRYPGRLTQVDLHKDDRGYEPMEVLNLTSPLLDRWRASGAVLDSAFRTRGGRYEWTYLGLRETSRA